MSQAAAAAGRSTLVDLAILWILASAVIKAMYKGRIQAEVKAAQAAENAGADDVAATRAPGRDVDGGRACVDPQPPCGQVCSELTGRVFGAVARVGSIGPLSIGNSGPV